MGPGRWVCRWAAAFLLVCLWPRQISGRRVACPPARRPRCELRSARRLEARPGPAGSAAASNRSGCLCLLWPCRRPPALRRGPAGLAAASNRSGCLCVVRPGPAAHGYRGLAPSIAQDSHPVVTSHIPEPAPSFACNSPTILSNFEIRLLELQRFQTLLKLHPIELHASFLGSGSIDACWCRSACPQTMRAVV